MRILMGSESPYVTTGYGTVTNELTRRWAKDHEVYAIGWQHFGNPVQLAKNLTVLPTDLNDPTGGGRTWKPYIEEYKPDVVITLIDIWYRTDMIAKFCQEMGVPYFNYFPVDGSPFYVGYEHALHMSTQPVCMSFFGRDVIAEHFKGTIFEREFSDLPVVYHGVDTKVFKPLDPKMRARLRTQFDTPDEPFVVLQVNRNVQRKNWPMFYEAFAKFVKMLDESERKNVVLLQKVGMLKDLENGHDLPTLAKQFGIDKYISNLDKVQNPLTGYTREEMARIYGMADVHVSASAGEGAGLSILESQACGIPNIHTNYTTAPELIGGHGWLVDVKAMWYGQYNTRLAIVDSDHMAKCIYEAFKNPEMRKEYGREAHKFMLQHDWSKKADEFVKLFKEYV